MTDWWDFVNRYMALRKMNGAQVAALAGFDKSRLTGWSRGGDVTPKLARDTAVALNAPVLDAFVAAGYLKPEDTTAEVIERPIKLLTDEELVAEVTRRLKEAQNVVEAQKKKRASREGSSPEEDALGARSGEPADTGKSRGSDAAEEIHDRFRRSVRAKTGKHPPRLPE